jgi:hypothetical protein
LGVPVLAFSLWTVTGPGSAASGREVTKRLDTVTLDARLPYVAAAIGGHTILGATPRQVSTALGPPALVRSGPAVTTVYYGPRSRGRWAWQITFRRFSAMGDGCCHDVCTYRRAWSMRSESQYVDADSGRPLVRPWFGVIGMRGEIGRDLDRTDPAGWTFSSWVRANGGTFSQGGEKGQAIDFGILRDGTRFLVVRLLKHTVLNLRPELACSD